MLDAFVDGLLAVFQWPTFGLMLAGIAIALVVGILPGINGAAVLAIMLPFTFTMEPTGAFAFLLGMIAVVTTAGDITSVLFGVPGESSSASLVLDGHQMTRRGEAGRALGAALMSSLVGAVIGAFALGASIPLVRPIVLSLASPEFFVLSILGLVLVGSVSGDSKLKGVLAAGAGVMISMVGLDPMSGVPRFTFGRLELWEGVGIVSATVGLFAIPEIVDMWVAGAMAEHRDERVNHTSQGIRDTFVHWQLTARASLLGTFLGILPALGATMAQWVAYGHAVQSARDRSRFGKGDVRGVLAPGAANNSTLGGSLIPTIAFGIPGTVIMALLLGAFVIHGLTPGPQMLTTNLSLTYSLMWLIVISNVIAVPICLLLLNQIVKVTYIRMGVLFPVLVLMVFLGGFTETNSFFGIALTFVFGLLGLVMSYLGWPRAPLVLGLVLGGLVERYFFISYNAYGFAFLTRPVIVAGTVLAVAVMVLLRLVRGRRSRHPQGAEERA